MTYEIKPNWGKWKHFHIVKLWQAVALSMNLDPKHIGRSLQGWLAGEDTILAKSLEFKERLDLAISNILKLTVEHMVPGRPAQWEVTLASFAAQAGRWWKSEVPPEMAALAEPEKRDAKILEWPWGSRETKLLGHLAEAAKELWCRDDRPDQHTGSRFSH